jgi:hypothetical protein
MRPPNLSFQPTSSEISLYTSFSGDGIFVYHLLTCPALPDLLGRDPKNGKHFYHDFYHHIHHCRRRRHCSVDFETTEEILDTLKYIDEGFLA